MHTICELSHRKTTASAHKACKSGGKRYPGARMLEGSNGAMVVCSDPKQVAGTQEIPYMVRRADLRSFADKSQRPRCNAKQRIEANCGSSELCVFKVNDALCTEPDVAKHTTHAQVEWKCRADAGWRFDRVERGRELVFDCRQ